MKSSAFHPWRAPGVVALCTVCGLATSAFSQVVPLNAITLEQISYPLDDNNEGANSMVGSITVDYSVIASAFPPPLGGFINLAYLPNGIQDPGQAVWLVYNLPVFGPGLDPVLPGASTYDRPTITTQFNLTPLPGAVLGAPLAVAQNIAVVYTSSPQENLNWVTGPGAIARNANITPLDKAIGGTGDTNARGFRTPPPVGPIVGGGPFVPLWVMYYQTGHQNVQAAHNQCAPMATANSFQYLEDILAVPIPDPHNIGLGGITPNYTPDGSLVGALDSFMRRYNAQGTVLQGRQSGGGMWPIQGALVYLARNDLAHQTYVSHALGGGVFTTLANPYTPPPPPNLVGNGNFTSESGMVSVGVNNNYDTSWLIDELDDHAGIMLDYGPSVHYVSVVGAGYLNLRPFLLHVSDYRQTNIDATDTRGCDRTDFDYVTENTKMLIQTGAPADQIVSFKKVTPRNLSTQCYQGNPVPIVDGVGNGTCGAVAAAEITIPAVNGFKVGLVRPSFHITHTYQGDVKVTLKKVGGPSVQLVNRAGVNAAAPFGFSAANYGANANNRFRSTNVATNGVYQVAPTGTVAAPGVANVAGDWKAEATLAAFVGQTAAGTWRLEVQDCAANDTGQIVSFCLELSSLSGTTLVPNCYANCDNSSIPPVLNANDFQCFLIQFSGGASYANCDGSTIVPVLNANDFLCFLNQFALGCS